MPSKMRKPLWTHPGLLTALLGASFIINLPLSAVVVFKGWREGLFVAEVAAVLMPAVVYLLITKGPWTGLVGVSRRTVSSVLLAAIAAACAWVTGMVLMNRFVQMLPARLVEKIEENAKGMEPLLRCETRHHWVWAILGVVVAAAVGEELLFRGVVQRGLQQRWSRTPALFLTAAIFAAFHLQPLMLPMLFALGLLFGWLYQRSGSLWPPIIAHATNNLLAVLVYNTGDAFDSVVEGPEWAWLVLGATAVGAAAVWAVASGTRPPRPPVPPTPETAPISSGGPTDLPGGPAGH